MNLDELRCQIDQIDQNLLQLFEQRMEIVKGVAAYKKENNLPIFHKDREDQIIQRISSQAAPENAEGANVLFSTLMNISKCLQQKEVLDYTLDTLKLLEEIQAGHQQPEHPTVGCQGVVGAYSYLACQKKFPNATITMFDQFEDVFQAVQNKKVDFGILPLENSNAGSVDEVYELMKHHNFYINHTITLKIDHCLAVRPGIKATDIQKVYSHNQALRQCSQFLALHHLPQESYTNTAAAAEFVAKSDLPIAAICSQESAKTHGLQILQQNIQNNDENYTRFMVISKKLYPRPECDTIATSLTISNAVGSLYNLLTKFAVNGVNLTKIESKPIGNKNFDVVFYLDFSGNILEEQSIHLLNELSSELTGFKFLGNYKAD